MDTEARLKAMIKENLHNCNTITTPTVCSLKNTPEGFASLEKEIFDRRAASGKTVGQVILEIEKEYSNETMGN